MAERMKPADDPKIKAAVGYGFDASLRKGTQAGFAAMRGSSEYQALDSKSKDVADQMFKRRIDTDTNLQQFKGIGDEKVSVYRNAAKEKPARVIDYKTEFGNKPSKAKTASAKPKAAKPAPKMTESAPIRKAMGMAPQPGKSPGDLRSYERTQSAASAPAKKTNAASSTLSKIMSIASPKQQKPPAGFKSVGSGPTSMLMPKFDKKK